MQPTQTITRTLYLADRHGKTFADVVNDPEAPFDEVLDFFNDPDRQRRMEESEIHHDRAPLAGVVRELEFRPAIHQFFASVPPRRSARLRQAIGLLVRQIMERRGWRSTGRKGSLGVRSRPHTDALPNNVGGLSLWFIRAERYQLAEGMPYRSVRERCAELAPLDRPGSHDSAAGKGA